MLQYSLFTRFVVLHECIEDLKHQQVCCILLGFAHVAIRISFDVHCPND